MNFADKLKYLRKKHNISQQELGEKIKLSRKAIIHYEKGEIVPKKDSIYEKIAEVFDVNVDFLRDDEKNLLDMSDNIPTLVKAKKVIHDFEVLLNSEDLDEIKRDEIMQALQNTYWNSIQY